MGLSIKNWRGYSQSSYLQLPCLTVLQRHLFLLTRSSLLTTTYSTHNTSTTYTMASSNLNFVVQTQAGMAKGQKPKRDYISAGAAWRTNNRARAIGKPSIS
jgi:hypothetical protein